jgi:hypothetical protein
MKIVVNRSNDLSVGTSRLLFGRRIKQRHAISTANARVELVNLAFRTRQDDAKMTTFCRVNGSRIRHLALTRKFPATSLLRGPPLLPARKCSARSFSRSRTSRRP